MIFYVFCRLPLQLSKKYGSVFTVYFGPKKVLVLAGYKTVKQALVNHAFDGRYITRILEDNNQQHGILFSNGDNWKEMRRFALSNLREFGMGKKTAENQILEECRYLIEVFEKHNGQPLDTTRPIMQASSNIISSIVYGSRFDYSDPQFKEMVDSANETFHLLGTAPIKFYNMFPWLGKWTKSVKIVWKNTELQFNIIKDIIHHLKSSLNPQMSRGLVDSFLIRKQNDQDSGLTDSHYHDNNLIRVVANLFHAGTDTTASTLRWALLIMAKYPHIQAKVQEELRRELGSRQVRAEDRKDLSYTNAVIHETQRLACIVSHVSHVTTQDVTLQGFFIRKGTPVFALLTSVLHDESEWETPSTFNPAHFLDMHGKFMKRDAFMPFSVGGRVCLGEGLARMELFLFFTSLLQRFRFTPPPGVMEEDLDLNPAVRFLLGPLPHRLCAISHV
ncbi:hypothetical protein NHX12_015017 [Muraenolepis orangiensis]|uniref:Cytochrome P450 n=1 Tax=Muraenolepis orangiensis TaxID=630683 RepID=A0A9Q0DD82_9TELE|nr:hypothetical protein NHX12_015017 [Muraenolepis orangiensis]